MNGFLSAVADTLPVPALKHEVARASIAIVDSHYDRLIHRMKYCLSVVAGCAGNA